MIKIEKTEVVGWEATIRGMRNPMNSWDKSDSGWTNDGIEEGAIVVDTDFEGYWQLRIGTNDQKLMMNLRNAGTDDRKFMRMIVVYCDITAPLYWLKEYDTYKVGTVANSCSTMHKLTEKEFTLNDFSCEHLIDDEPIPTRIYSPIEMMRATVANLNQLRGLYLRTKDKKHWWQMIQLLPSSYNQKRTVMLNYEVLANMYHARKNHKLDEWRDFCKWIESLPFSKLITGERKQ